MGVFDRKMVVFDGFYYKMVIFTIEMVVFTMKMVVFVRFLAEIEKMAVARCVFRWKWGVFAIEMVVFDRKIGFFAKEMVVFTIKIQFFTIFHDFSQFLTNFNPF
jgi:hypothetical protein